MRATFVLASAPLVLGLLLPGCNKKEDELTYAEATQALDEASADNQASATTTVPVEISTHFTLGQAVEQAAVELSGFIATELPCAQVTLSGSTVTTHWGAAGGTCLYKGMTFSGTTSVTVKRIDPGTVEVDHTWTDFSNGKVEVSGTAVVTWSAVDASRHVVHELTWTRLSDGKTGVGSGDRTQRLLDPAQGLAGGIGVDGNRHWSGERGDWDLAITGVQMRPEDPVPQAGSYQLTTPANKVLTLSFARQSADVIQVTIAGPKRSFSFNVRQAGTVSDG